MRATKRDLVFVMPFIAFALWSIGIAVYQLIGSGPYALMLVVTLVASVAICDPFGIRVSHVPGLPKVGVAIILLAIFPLEESPLTSVGMWVLGIVMSQLLQRRTLPHAFYAAGLGALSAFAFIAVYLSFADFEVWLPLNLFVSASAFYAVTLLGEFARQGGRWARDGGLGLSALSPYRVALVVLVVAATSTLMSYVSLWIIPWLDYDPNMRRTPLVMLLTASLFYGLAQRVRLSSIERGLGELLKAAVELPRHPASELPAVLKSLAQSVVQANDIQISDTAPLRDEIGAEVSLESGIGQFLVASRRVGGAPFGREDGLAIVALAHLASEAARVQRDVETLERRANSDPLTGLPNFGAFQKALIEINENRPYHEGIAVLFIDLDNFKRLNDNRGHHAGDELLAAVAERLQGAAGGGDFVSRVGGDEFVVILTGLVSLVQAKESADRIVEAVSQPMVLEGHETRPVVSAGLAFSSHRELDAQTLVLDADRAMLQIKRSRRQGGPVEGSSVSIAPHRSERTNDIVARAIRDNKLLLAFQPIVSIDQGKIWAFEALVRYVDPELGPISPSSLVARSKSLGLMNDLTRQIITKALDAADEFYRLEPSIACITVNLELGQISEAELGPFIRDTARAHPNISLCIELNERSLHSVTDDLRREAEIMRDTGVIIALDDYGSDESSVGALVRFPMDILKIDKSLIDDLDDVRQREVLKALQGFGDNLDYTIVVEGIENAAMVDVMVQIGVRSAQGYFYGRPLSLEGTMDRIRRWGTQAVIG